MGFTANNSGVRKLLVVLLILFALGATGYCTRSEAQEGLSIGFGVATAGSDNCFESLLLMQTFAERKWAGYLTTHGDSNDCRGEHVQANIAAGIVRTTHLNRWSIGFGVGVLEHGDIVIGPEKIRTYDAPRVAQRPQVAAAILIRRRLGERFSIDLLHHSTGGSTAFNPGLNSLTLSATF